jgi:hypothetical protein
MAEEPISKPEGERKGRRNPLEWLTRDKKGKFINTSGKPKPVRKTIPGTDTPMELITAIDEGKLDERTHHGKKIKAIKDVVTANFEEAAKAILRSDIANNLIIQRALMDYALKNPDKLVDEKGELAPALAKHFLRFQDATRRSIYALSHITGIKADPAQEEKDAGDFVLEVMEGDGL